MKWVVSLGGVGFLRPAPGTWGSLAVLPVALLGPAAAALLALLLLLVGLWALRRLPEADQDPGWVVIDEGAGQALALAALSPGFGWLGLALAFALFRLFDIWKPGPVRMLDRQKNPAGVMGDDIMAGAMAGLVLLLLQSMGVPL
jgi:phosphatidylglycerophosphatase A